MCFNERWLLGHIPDSAVDGAGLGRRNFSGKIKGDGLALFVYKPWCDAGYIVNKECVCSLDI